MSIAVTCPQCQAKYSVAAERLSPKMKCAKCGAAIDTAAAMATAAGATKPAVKSASAAAVDPMYLEEVTRALSTGTLRPPGPLNMQRNNGSADGDFLSKPLFWIGGGLVILVLFVGLGSYVLFRPASNEDAYSLSLKKQKKKPVVALVGQTDAEEPAAAEETVKLPPPSPAVPKATASPTAPAPAAGAKPSGTVDPNAPRVKLAVADLIDSVRDAVVHITVKDEDGEAFATGSGFVIRRFSGKKWKWRPPEKKADGDDETPNQPKSEIEGDLWLVATNYHVIAGSHSATIRMRDGTTFESLGMAAMSRERDLAILALDKAPDDLKLLTLADDKSGRQGEEVVAIGHPIGFDFTVSTGIISAVRGTKDLPDEVAEWIDAPADQQWIQTTAAISSGNSGGPLLSMYGDVVGVNTWVVRSGENLAFSSHVRHLSELAAKAVDESNENYAMTLTSFKSAKPAEVPLKIGDRDNWLETEVREELTRSTTRALEVDWRPGSRGDYVSFQSASLMLVISEVYRYRVPEAEKILQSLKKKTWDFEKEVAPVNRYAIACLADKERPVMLLGQVRRVNKVNSRNFTVDLSGRGFTVAVTVPSTSAAPKLEVGDAVAVCGYWVGMTEESPSLPRKVHEILAGLVASVKLPDVPDDASLLAAYDLIKHDRQDQGCEEHIRKYVDDFPRIVPMLGKTAVRWQRVDLNSRHRQFDAVRFTVPAELHADLVWSFNDVSEVVESWGIMPVKNFFLPWEANHLELRGFTAPGLTRDDSKLIVVQGLGNGLLVPGEDYLLWFCFKDGEPRRLAIAARLVPVDSFNPADNNSLGTAMKDGTAFKPDVLARVTKAMKPTPSATPSSTPIPTATTPAGAER